MRLLHSVVRLPLKLTLEIARRAASAVGLAKDGDGAGTAVRVPPEPSYVPQAAPPPPPARAGGNGGAPAVAPEREEPVHVSEEPELVAETAEQGAEEGAGAEVRVAEPWPGYSRMTAADIKGRLRSEPAEVAAAVSLYEASGKGRSSVLEAAARRLGPSARPSG
jgi:hypothetical protein